MWAMGSDSAALVAKLLGADADVNARTTNGTTALMVGFANGSVGSVRVLLEKSEQAEKLSEKMSPCASSQKGNDIEADKTSRLLASWLKKSERLRSSASERSGCTSYDVECDQPATLNERCHVILYGPMTISVCSLLHTHPCSTNT